MRVLSIILAVVISTQVQAATEDDGASYETIINRLGQSETRYSSEDSAFDRLKIHVGVGLSNNFMILPDGNGASFTVAQRGVQASMGLDLFSDYWIAEGAVLNYGEGTYEKAKVAIREFDLKILYRQPFGSFWGTKLGVGIASRSLRIQYSGSATPQSREYNTPMSILSGALDAYVSDRFSIGAELAARNSLTDETPDQSAIDLMIRVDGRF